MRPHVVMRPARRSGCLRSILGILLLGVLALNGLAWIHARAMTHFVADGQPLDALITAPLSAKVWALMTGVRIPRPQNRQTPRDHYLPYEVRQIPLPNNEVLEGWLVPHPQSRGVILMFTGYAGVKDGLLTPAAHMYQFGYSSLLVDFRGSGESSRNDTTLGMREADDVAAAFAYAKHEWPDQPLVLYGVSMGSAAILRAAAVNGVRPAAIIVEGVFDRFLTTARHRFDAVGVPSFPAAELLVFWGSVQMGYNGFRHNPIDYATAVECPILVLHGALDPWITTAETNAIVERIRGSKRMVEVPGVGHDMPYVYRAPDLWVQTVKQFLAQRVATSAP